MTKQVRWTMTGVLSVLVLFCCLLTAAHGQEIQFSDARIPQGNYTATLEELAAKRLMVYGIFAEMPDLSAVPRRSDAAQLLFRAAGRESDPFCFFSGVPEEYEPTVSWLYDAGFTSGNLLSRFWEGPVTEEQLCFMVSRLLDLGVETENERWTLLKGLGILPLGDQDPKLTYGDLCQVICGLLDHAYPERCIHQTEKVSTPGQVSLTVSGYADALEQTRKALGFLPREILLRFAPGVPSAEEECFAACFGWRSTEVRKPFPSLIDTRWEGAYRIQKVEDHLWRVEVYRYTQAAQAYAASFDWLDVYQDRDFSESLRRFYAERLHPVKKLSLWRRVQVSHDLLCELAEYDDSEYDSLKKRATGKRPEAHRLMGFVENGRIVCDGYANTYSWMLLHLNVDSYVVHGRGNDEGHAWNKVCMQGTWYNTDVCWDDTGRTAAYYLRSDAVFLQKNHSFLEFFSTSLFGSPRDCGGSA